LKLSELDLASLGPIPRDETGPLFAEPWQAELLALTLQLSEAGHFTWSEWGQAFGAVLETARDCGPNDPTSYYDHWLQALQNLLEAKKLIAPGEVSAMRDAWAAAYERTPHGKPVMLEN